MTRKNPGHLASRIEFCAAKFFENSPNGDCPGKNGTNGIPAPRGPAATEMRTRASRTHDVTINYHSKVILVNGPSLTAVWHQAAKSNIVPVIAHTKKYLCLFVYTSAHYTWHWSQIRMIEKKKSLHVAGLWGCLNKWWWERLLRFSEARGSYTSRICEYIMVQASTLSSAAAAAAAATTTTTTQ